MKLYRIMRIDPSDGGPLVGTRRSMLGVRPTDPTATASGRKPDVSAVGGGDTVSPGAGQGLSVSTDPGVLYPGKNEAVWVVEDTDLVPDLKPAADGPPHHVLEPARPMTLDEYQAALAATRGRWTQAP